MTSPWAEAQPQRRLDPSPLVLALLAMDRIRAAQLLEAGARAGSLAGLAELVSGALEVIGDGWERGDVSLAQIYLTARVCQDLLEPYLGTTQTPTNPRAALVVLEDHHLLGARIVRAVLACAGIVAADWGALDVNRAVDQALRDKPAILLVSTLMQRSALLVAKLTRALRDAGQDTRVVVGGAPFRFDPLLWREVGADAMGRTAADAVGLVRALEVR